MPLHLHWFENMVEKVLSDASMKLARINEAFVFKCILEVSSAHDLFLFFKVT